ncbi:MAG: SpoIID/LytB domain-containing protein [Phycisphaerae bacterium]
MSNTRGAVNIRQWTREAGVEPTLRVGIILDQDAFDSVCLCLPEREYRMDCPGSTSAALQPQTTIEVRRAEDALAVRIAGAPQKTVSSLRLSSIAIDHRRDAGATRRGTGVLVRDVVAGRGFHWQKRIDQRLAGVLELLPGPRGVVLVNELPLEDYLAGVITAEMSGECPRGFLKAQCVVARSWLLAMTEPKHESEPFDRCNDDCCQRYQGTGDLSATALEAVRATRGLALLDPAGNVLDANYSKSCGGISETPRTVWGVDKPGLTPIVDAPADADERRFFPVTEENFNEYLDGEWLKATRIYCSPNVVPVGAIRQYLGRVDEVGDYFRWTVRYERRELEQLLIEKLPEPRRAGTAHRRLAVPRDLRVTARGVSGRAYVVEIEWEDQNARLVRARLGSEYRIRQVLHRRFLYSSAFAVRTKRDADGRLRSVTLRGAGWGHGVGLCQIGALGMALSGIDFKTICRHYYPETRLTTVYA